jgi:hypothetical protein
MEKIDKYTSIDNRASSDLISLIYDLDNVSDEETIDKPEGHFQITILNNITPLHL